MNQRSRLYQRYRSSFLLPALGLLASPAYAAGGGSTLPFNEALTTITDNLTGPTASTIIVALIVAALLTIGLSKEPWLKTLGGAVVICALLAKVTSLPGILGLSAATGEADAFRYPAIALSAVVFLLLSAPLIHFLIRACRVSDARDERG